jgi:putative ABC transport system substrate-binding protein
MLTNLAHPEGNTTGITNLFASIGGKWLQLLKEIAPKVERVGLIYNSRVTPDETLYGFSPSIDEAARPLAIQTVRLGYRDAVDLVRAIDQFSAQENSGLIIVPPSPNGANLETILRLATQHRLPAIYGGRELVAAGGLAAYGSVAADRYRRAASFVDRILHGAKVSELPVEYPTKFELVINLAAAKAIGLTIPEAVLLRADELIQ